MKRKSEELAEIILTEFDEIEGPLTHDERVAKIIELERAGRMDILAILDALLMPDEE